MFIQIEDSGDAEIIDELFADLKSFIMLWSVLILWLWKQANQRMATEKIKNTFDSL